MSDVHAEVHAKPGYLEIIFHHDHETPLQFLIELLHSVFNKQLADALRLTDAMRADVQAAVDRLFSAAPIRFFGIHEEHRYETLTISTLTRDGRHAAAIAPAQYHEVDVGESAPVKCLDNGLWLCATEALRYAVVL